MAKRASLYRHRSNLAARTAAPEGLVRDLGEGVCALDERGSIVAANPAAEAMLGYGPDELLGTEAGSVLLLPGREQQSEWSSFYSGAISRNEHHAFRRKDGTLLPVSYTASPMRGVGGVDGIVLVFRDISEQRRKFALLEGQEEVLQLLAKGRPLVDVLTCLVRVIEDCFPNMICTVSVADAEQSQLQLTAAPSLPQGFSQTAEDVPIGPNVGSCGTAAYRRELVVVEDVLADPLWLESDIGASAAAHGLRACSSQPILTADGRVLGTFAMYYRQPWRPPESELDLIRRAAHLAGLAIERSQTDVLLRQANADLEAKVQERTAFLNALLDSMEEGIVACDANGVITLFNAPTRRLHGKDERPLRPEQWTETFNLLDLNGAPLAKEDLPLYRALHGERVEGIEVMVAPPGRSQQVFAVKGRALYDEAGRKLGAVVALHDVTARKIAERERMRLVQAQIARAEAEAAQAKVTDILESITDAFISVDRAWRLTYINSDAERIAGAGRERLLGKTIWQIYADGLGTPLFAALEDAVRRQQPVALEHYDVARNTWYEVQAYPAKDGGMSIYFRDIDARKRVEAELRDMVRARDVFLSVCSHELKTPLTALNLHTQLVQRRLRKQQAATLDAGEMLDLVNGFDRQTQRLVRLVDDMLDISRISTGKLRLRLADVELGELVHEVVGRFKPQIAASGSELRLDLEGPVRGSWDHYRIEQVLINLLTNALRYGCGRPIEIHIGTRDGRAVMKVRDEGFGIAEADQERIFRRFERAVSASEVSGLGLGLYIVKQIVAAHGGSVWVESALGQGASFVVELPLQLGTPP